MPVKNEDGVVIMFILNFEVMTDRTLRHHREELNHRLPTWLVTGDGVLTDHFFVFVSRISSLAGLN